MSQNFNYSNGNIGTWKNIPVWVQKKSQYDQEDRHDPDIIYAISVNDYDQLTLVKGEKMIGIMTPAGDVKEFGMPQPYLRSKSKKKKDKPMPQKDENEYVPVEYKAEEIADLDLLELSAPIDQYLEAASKRVIYETVLFSDAVG